MTSTPTALVEQGFKEIGPLFGYSPSELTGLRRPTVLMKQPDDLSFALGPLEEDFYFDDENYTLLLSEVSTMPLSYGVGFAVADFLLRQRNPTVRSTFYTISTTRVLDGLANVHAKNLQDQGLDSPPQRKKRVSGLRQYAGVVEAMHHYGGLALHKVSNDGLKAPTARELKNNLIKSDKRVGDGPRDLENSRDYAIFELKYLGRKIAERLYEDHPPEAFTGLVTLPLEDAIARIEDLTGTNLYTFITKEKK